jgi:hypothetical protein
MGNVRKSAKATNPPAKTTAERVAEHRRRKELALAEAMLSLRNAAGIITDFLLKHGDEDVPLIIDNGLLSQIEAEIRERFPTATPPMQDALRERLQALKIKRIKHEAFVVLSARELGVE